MLSNACSKVLARDDVPEAIDVPLEVVVLPPAPLSFDLHSGDEQIVPIERALHSFRRVRNEMEVLDGVRDFAALKLLNENVI